MSDLTKPLTDIYLDVNKKLKNIPHLILHYALKDNKIINDFFDLEIILIESGNYIHEISNVNINDVLLYYITDLSLLTIVTKKSI